MESQATTIQQLKGMLSNESVKSRFQEILGKKAAGFISSVMQVASNNTLLQKAQPQSIMNAAVIAATLDLPINPCLGFAAIVPYKDQAQFQLMYKGLVELCQRSGQFSAMIDEVVYDGQLISKNKFTGEYLFNEEAKKSDTIIGYMAYFRLANGFEKTMYMTLDEVKKHATSYSQTYRKGYGIWKDNFDVMARKTVLKLLLAKYAPKSVEMQRAITFDQAIIKNDLTANSVDDAEIEYVDNMETETKADKIKDILKNGLEQDAMFPPEENNQ